MSGLYLLSLPWPDKLLSQNTRAHWTKKSKATKAARTAAWVEAQKRNVPFMKNARLVFAFFPPDNRRRDSQNMPAMMKAYIDGIAQAMDCDDRGFRCEFPSRFERVVKGGCVLVEISDGTSPQTVVSVEGI